MGKTLVMQSTIDHLVSSKQPNVLGKLMSGEWDKCEMENEVVYYKKIINN